MEFKKNSDIVKLLFKMKNIEKIILNTSCQLKGIKVTKTSIESYNHCHKIYNEGASYFYQCCGFLKSQYFEDIPSHSGKSFFINNLFVPAYKRFLSLRQNLSVVKTDDIYNESMKLLQDKVDYINSSFSELLAEVNEM